MAPIVYDLKSKIIGRYTTDRMVVKDVMLYDTKSKELKIQNPFTKDCDFNIEIEYLPSTNGDKVTKRRVQPNLSPRSTKNNASSETSQSRVLPSFFINQDKIQLRKGRSNKLKITYLPLTFEVHHCYIILTDEEVGEL